MSTDEVYLLSRDDLLSVVRNSHTAAQNSRLSVSRDEGYSIFANRPVIGGAELPHQSTEQQAFCEQRRKAPYFANRTVIGGAELSHHSAEQQALCEQRRMLP